jgi:hypothetical protein
MVSMANADDDVVFETEPECCVRCLNAALGSIRIHNLPGYLKIINQFENSTIPTGSQTPPIWPQNRQESQEQTRREQPEKEREDEDCFISSALIFR